MSRNLSAGCIEAMDNNVILVEFNEFTQVSGNPLILSRMYGSVHGLTSLAAVRNCINGKSCTAGNITAGEDIGSACLKRNRIMHDSAVRIQFDIFALEQIAPDS